MLILFLGVNAYVCQFNYWSSYFDSFFACLIVFATTVGITVTHIERKKRREYDKWYDERARATKGDSDV